MTRFGIEEYVSDCVILLDHRVDQEVSTRRLRVVKYRGSLHGTNEYPFLITQAGLVVVPITSVGLDYDAPTERVSTGIEHLDEMLAGGIYHASTMLVGGGAGTGKTSIGGARGRRACRRGEHALFFSLEESPAQLIRNMASIGIDLQTWVDAGALRIISVRATSSGLEEHLATLRAALDEMTPSLVVLDAVASLARVGTMHEIASIISRDLDMLRSRGITAVLTALTPEEDSTSGAAVASLVDAWVHLRNHEHVGERVRMLSVVKSRGSSHSNKVRELLLTDEGRARRRAGPRGDSEHEVTEAVTDERRAGGARARRTPRGVRAEALRRGPDATLRARDRQPAQGVRGAPRRPLPARGHRPPQGPHPGQG